MSVSTHRTPREVESPGNACSSTAQRSSRVSSSKDPRIDLFFPHKNRKNKLGSLLFIFSPGSESRKKISKNIMATTFCPCGVSVLSAFSSGLEQTAYEEFRKQISRLKFGHMLAGMFLEKHFRGLSVDTGAKGWICWTLTLPTSSCWDVLD